MIKKININQLKTGMFIHDLNCKWLDHPFLANRVNVKNEKTIEKLIDYGIREVYIDTEKGIDIVDPPIGEEEEEALTGVFENVAETPPEDSSTVPVQEELVRAKEIKHEAKQTVQNIMEDVRLGKQIEIQKVDHVVGKMVDSIFRNKGALISLGRIKKIDDYTFEHSVSVAILMIAFARHLGFDYDAVKAAGVGGLLHDVGKVKIPAELLKNTNGLSPEQFETVKKHVEYGCEILEETPGIEKNSLTVAKHHHERLNGTGYPENLRGDQIDELGQMAAIVDVYDAMTSKRCYQRQYQPTETLRKLFEWRNIYDEELAQQFIKCVGIYPVGTLVLLVSGLLAVGLEHREHDLLCPVVCALYDTKKKRHIMPLIIDLAKNKEDKVKSCENPKKWKIDPMEYL